MSNIEKEKIESLISVEGIPLQHYLLNGVKTQIPVLFQIKVGNREETTGEERPGFDLCIVLDRSGSMSGDKIQNSIAAINNLIDQLIPDDTISLVIYDDYVEVVFEKKRIYDKEKLKEDVQKVTARGGTNLCAGMEAGIEILKNIFSESRNRLKRVFLFSDGLVNEGIRSPDVICDRARLSYQTNGISISTFGVGDDFDEKIMKNVAKSGEGMFFYISKSESIPSIISKGLRGLTSTVGVDTYLKFRGLNGSKLIEIKGDQTPDALLKGTFLRELKEGDWKRILVYVDVEPFPFNEENIDKKLSDEKGILFYSLNFNIRVKNERNEFSLVNSSINGKINCKFTDDDSLVTDIENIRSDTHSAIVILEVGADDAKVIKLIDENRIDEAISLKKSICERLEKIKDVDKIADALYKLAIDNLSTLQRRDVAKAKKEAVFTHYMEEEEGDMGFGLFD